MNIPTQEMLLIDINDENCSLWRYAHHKGLTNTPPVKTDREKIGKGKKKNTLQPAMMRLE